MNILKFTKMQGLGNDFVIVDGQDVKGIDYASLSVKICDRKFGIGADGLIIVNPVDFTGDTDISWRIINSDGSEPQMCGNGIRCFAKYAFDKGIVDKKKFTVKTLAGTIIPEILDNGEVKVDMGAPILEPAKIPVNFAASTAINQPIEANEKLFHYTAVSMGNPHCVIFSKDNTAQLAEEYGPYIEKHQLFPEKTNVEFVKILSDKDIVVDVWERGCGITLACGTGTCASVVAAVLNGLTGSEVKAKLPGGYLNIQWNRESNKIYMTGKAEYVFTGEYLLV